jgi:hypothetical protein
MMRDDSAFRDVALEPYPTSMRTFRSFFAIQEAGPVVDLLPASLHFSTVAYGKSPRAVSPSSEDRIS